jgi:hypothetical protein
MIHAWKRSVMPRGRRRRESTAKRPAPLIAGEHQAPSTSAANEPAQVPEEPAVSQRDESLETDVAPALLDQRKSTRFSPQPPADPCDSIGPDAETPDDLH